MSETICHCVRPGVDEGDYDAPYTLVRAMCGDECLLDPDGWTIPDDFDFVLAPDPRRLTDCLPCLQALAVHARQLDALVGAS